MGRPTNEEIAARKAAQAAVATEEMDPVVSETAPAEPTDPSTALADALMAALERVKPAQPGLSKDDLADVLSSNAEGMRRALKPENAQHPDKSVFNPDGERDHPRPQLKRKCFMSPGIELRRDELTVDEIEVLNSFEHTMEARNGQWRAEFKRTATDGTSELHITIPSNTVDERMELPKSLLLILRELRGGTAAVDETTLAKRVAELERQLAATSVA